MTYSLSKNHYLHNGNPELPVLIGDGVAGPFDLGSTLEGGSTAREVCMRKLTKDPLPTDPSISCEEGASFLDRYLWEFLTYRTPKEVFEFAEMYHALKKRGIKIPGVALAEG